MPEFTHDDNQDDAYSRRMAEETPPPLSTGEPSTLKSYRRLSAAFFGAESPAVKYLDKLIAESPNGENEYVLAAESQMIHLLAGMTLEGYDVEKGNGCRTDKGMD